MSKKSIIILWGVNIALYVTNIILSCIYGATLTTCIIGWVIASMLAGLIIFLQCMLADRNEIIDKMLDDYAGFVKEQEEFICKYPYHYSEQYMLDNKKLQAENEELKKEIKELTIKGGKE